VSTLAGMARGNAAHAPPWRMGGVAVSGDALQLGSRRRTFAGDDQGDGAIDRRQMRRIADPLRIGDREVAGLGEGGAPLRRGSGIGGERLHQPAAAARQRGQFGIIHGPDGDHGAAVEPRRGDGLGQRRIGSGERQRQEQEGVADHAESSAVLIAQS